MTGRCARMPSSASPGCRTLGLRLPSACGPLVKLSSMWGGECKGGCRHSACAHLYTCCGMQHFCPLVCMGYSVCLGLGSPPLLIRKTPSWGHFRG